MPRKPKAQPAALPAIPAELLEQFCNGPMTAEAINAATLALKKALIERALGGEMNHHLGYPAGAAKPTNATNQRNGKGAKTVRFASRCRATAKAASTPSLFPSTNGASRASTTRSSPCMPGA